MSKEEITKHKSETHEVAVALRSRAYPELAVALSVPVLSFIEGVEGVEREGPCFEFSFLEIYNYHT